MRTQLGSSAGKFFVGVIVGAVLFSGSAIAVNHYVSDNSPANGYLLCANLKTKAVTFPNKLSCPSGTKALDLGAVTGVEGPEGPEGPQGPQGLQGPAGTSGTSSTGKVYWGRIAPSIDIVADGNITSSKDFVRKIMYTVNATAVPSGYYSLRASLTGLWSDAAGEGSYAECFFQSNSDFVAKSSSQWGTAMIEKGEWNSFFLNVIGDWFTTTDAQMHLVCSTSGTLKGVTGAIEATSIVNAGKFAGASS